MPDNWFSVPSFAPFKDLQAEIQIRTLAQHIWAAASHVLQYKREASVPYPLKRSIHRVSALLETVDLEFERLLEAREGYRDEKREVSSTETLNVDILEAVLDKCLPSKNKDFPDNYSELLDELMYLKLFKAGDLALLLKKHMETILKEDASYVSRIRKSEDISSDQDLVRVDKKGAFFTHAGLTRLALEKEFGEKWEDYMKEKAKVR